MNECILLFRKGVFTRMNAWMIGKNSMKHHYLRRKIFKFKQTWKIIIKEGYTHAETVCKDFEITLLLFYYTIFFAVQKSITLNSTHYLMMKIPNN